MTKTQQALKLALEALESCSAGDYSTGHVIHPSFDVDAVNRAIEAIEALAEQPAQQQELARIPVLIKRIEHEKAQAQKYFELYNQVCETAQLRLKEIARLDARLAAAQPQQEPMGEIVMFGGDLKEVSWKNGKMPPVGSALYTSSQPAQRQELPACISCGAAPTRYVDEGTELPGTYCDNCGPGGVPAQQQEPVAWATQMNEYAHIHWGAKRPEYPVRYEVPLYTSPPAQRKPWAGLTDEEIDDIDFANWNEDYQRWNIRRFARSIEAKLKEKNA